MDATCTCGEPAPYEIPGEPGLYCLDCAYRLTGLEPEVLA